MFLCLPLIFGTCQFFPAFFENVQDEVPLQESSRIEDAHENIILQENSYDGTTDWKLDNPANDLDLQIKGYASSTSVNQGDEITFYISTAPSQEYTIEIYRIGWYGGSGGRLITQVPAQLGTTQSVPVPDPTTGLLELTWLPSYTFTVPDTWVSGIYLAKLINARGYDNYIQFVVRDDDRIADFLYQQPVTTYQAYNNFPDNGSTGKSLYGYNSYGEPTASGGQRGVIVSFDRPYEKTGESDFFKWEQDLIMWMERAGYDVTYSTNIDTHRNGANLLTHKVFLSAGHDEYWTEEMFNAAEQARDQGTHLVFMGANAVYWQIRLEESSSGAADRIMVSYKDQALDPEEDNARKSIKFAQVGRPEQALRGVNYADYSDNQYTDYIVQNSNHWIYANTGFVDGDRVKNIVGYEVDTVDNSLPMPPHTDLTILSASPFETKRGTTVISNAVIFQAPSGAWVFSSGTMSWSNALNDRLNIDSRLQQTTANLFDRLANEAAPAVTHPGEQRNSVGEAVELIIVAADSTGAALTYTAEQLPDGLAINQMSGVISGQISASQTQSYKSSVRVNNGTGSTTVFFSWDVD